MKILLLNHNPLSHDCHIHEVRARQSTSSFHLVPSSEAALAFSADSLEPACLSNKQLKKGWCRSELPCLKMLKMTGLLLRHPGLVLVLR